GLSGVIVWYTYADAIGVDPWLYSFVLYNLPYMAASFAFCLILGLIPYKQKLWSYGLNIKQ
ncbi:MAG TPA: energy-coupled thiamine transporter ThiT, partial [Bacillota bacterium]|nr:energy-coupled thiamine transporter ThiT [Bacillota bacterium]